VHHINPQPKIHTLGEVVSRDARTGVDFGNPKFLVDALVDREVLSFELQHNLKYNLSTK
jgi:hypothetical protein